MSHASHKKIGIAARALTYLALLLLSNIARAQTIRGTVVDRADRPLAGVVVVLLDSAATTVGRSLTNELGEYRLSAPSAGAYRLRAVRIGFRPVVSNVLRLAVGSTSSERLVLDGVRVELSERTVVARTSCRRQTASADVMSVWDQAVASMATVVLGSTSGLTATTAQFVRELDASGSRIRAQRGLMRTANITNPWRSSPADSLHSLGYVWVAPGDSLTYHAPGLDVFLSPTFLQDHCLQPTAAADSSEIGIAFEPIPERRKMAEVQGTLWMSRATAELRRMEFSFVNVPGMREGPSPAGGAMTFTRLRDGAVLITGWDIMMPALVKTNSRDRFPRVTAITATGGQTVVLRRGTDTLLHHPFVSVQGIVRDSVSNNVVAGATVTLAGTTARAVTDARGRFTFTDVIPGNYSLVTRTASLDSIGAKHEWPLFVVQKMPEIALHVPSAGYAAEMLCPASRDSSGKPLGAVVGIVRAGADSSVVRNLALDANWTRFSSNSANATVLQQIPHRLATRTDETGAYRLCGLPIDFALTINARPPRGVPASANVRLSDKARVARIVFNVDAGQIAEQQRGTITSPSPQEPRQRSLASLSGTVIDTASRPLIGADVSIPSLNLSTRTDSSGQFRIADIPAGVHTIVVRRVGYGAVTTSLEYAGDEPKARRFMLQPITALESVAVKATRLDANEADFESRRRMGIGTFLTREKLQQFDEHSLARILPQLPGARIIRGNGNRAWVASLRSNGGLGVEGKAGLSTSDKMSGASSSQCYAKVYVNNVLLYGGGNKETLFDANSMQISDVEAVEYYAGAAQTPARYGGLGAHCGVLVIWTRKRGDQ